MSYSYTYDRRIGSSTDLKGAKAYIKRIKNSGKKKYAEAWLKYCQGKGERPENKKFGISFMAAQAVRMSLEDFGFEPTLDN